MAITSGYLTLAAFKASGSWGAKTDHDSDIERAVEAASRSIDRFCGRRFWLDGTASARYVTARPEETLNLPVPDIGSTTGLTVKTDDDWDGVYENTWTKDLRSGSYGFMLEPANAAADALPFTLLHAVVSSFPTVPQGVEVTAKWGWPAVPIDVAEACLILAGRLVKRKDAPFGVVGTPEVGVQTLPRVDPDVRGLLNPYRRIR